MPRGRKITRITEKMLMDVATEFYTHNKVKGLAEDTQGIYKNYIGAFIRWCGLDTKITELSPELLEEYYMVKLNEGLKPISVQTIAKHLRRFVNFTISRGYCDDMEVTIPRVESTIKEPYTEAELEKLLRKPKTNNWVEWRNWTMCNYFLATGQRLSTVLNIKVEHLDLENKRVKLEWNKDKIQKYMPLSSAIIKVLKEYIRLSGLQEDDWLFPEYEGEQLKRRSAEDSLSKYNKSRKVERTGIHLFRHTFAKNYIMNGGNPAKLQKLLNHKSMDMTMKYVRLYGDDIGADLDLYNPLDNFQKNKTSRRKTIV